MKVSLVCSKRADKRHTWVGRLGQAQCKHCKLKEKVLVKAMRKIYFDCTKVGGHCEGL